MTWAAPRLCPTLLLSWRSTIVVVAVVFALGEGHQKAGVTGVAVVVTGVAVAVLGVAVVVLGVAVAVLGVAATAAALLGVVQAARCFAAVLRLVGVPIQAVVLQESHRPVQLCWRMVGPRVAGRPN